MATIKFLLQSESANAPIYLRLSVGKGITPKRRTREAVDAKNWSKSKGFPNDKDAEGKNLKGRLVELSSFVLKHFNADDAKGLKIDGDWLQKVIDRFHDRIEPDNLDSLATYCDHFLNRLPYSVSSNGKKGVDKTTITKYATIVDKLKSYEQFRKKAFLVRDVNLAFRDDFLEYLEKEHRLSDNTAGRYIGFVKTIILHARRNGVTVSPQIDDFRGFTTKIPIVYLDFDEIERLKLALYKDERLEAARDWLVLSCFLGQRASDLLRMTKEMIEVYQGLRVVSLVQQKTQKLVHIPLHYEVEAILEKRSGEFPPTFSKNPASNSAIYDKLLKDVCAMAKIDSPTEGNLTNPLTGTYGTGTYPKWMLVSSHTGRRSFASNFYAQPECPTPVLMSVTGHATETMFLAYIGKKPIDYAVQLGEIWEKKRLEAVNAQGATNLRIAR